MIKTERSWRYRFTTRRKATRFRNKIDHLRPGKKVRFTKSGKLDKRQFGGGRYGQYRASKPRKSRGGWIIDVNKGSDFKA